MQKVKVDGKVIYQVKEDDIHLAVDMVKFAYNNAYAKWANTLKLRRRVVREINFVRDSTTLI